jgi:hypothetical protein
MRLTRQIIDLGHEIRIKQIINYNFKSTQMMNDEIKKTITRNDKINPSTWLTRKTCNSNNEINDKFHS